jgi:hypothetical protein
MHNLTSSGVNMREVEVASINGLLSPAKVGVAAPLFTAQKGFPLYSVYTVAEVEVACI